MNILTALSDRVVGQYPLSIATSLAFEGLADILEEGKRYKTPPIHQYEKMWINVRTLIRNILGSVDKEIAAQVLSKDLSHVLVSEFTIIDTVLKDLTQGRCQAVFYVCEYRSLSKLYPKALVKNISTDKQRFQAGLENAVISELLTLQTVLDNPIQHFDTTLRPQQKDKAVILTHYPFDLLSYDHFGLLDLIESHTGAIKKKFMWNTKLNNGKSLTRIPFDRMTVQLFGDSGGLLTPYPPAYRKALLAVAEQYQWNTLTTKDRIKLTVKLGRDPGLNILVTELYL